MFDLLLGDRDASEMRDAADGGGVDRHGVVLLPPTRPAEHAASL
jgi:hypothetical protein